MGYSPPSSSVKFDANGNVLSNVNAQNINPNVNTVNNPTIANPYTPTLLSHQTGLSVTPTTASTFYAIGSVISVSRTGILRITVAGYVNAGAGFIQLALTRSSNTYLLGNVTASLFSDGTNKNDITDASPTLLIKNVVASSNALTTYVDESDYALILPVYAGDSLQFNATNNVAGDITYIDDLLVIEQ